MLAVLLLLLVVAAVFHLLLAGAGVVRLAVQFPARRTLTPVALARYFRATDLEGGFLLYPLLGAGGPIVTWAALAGAVVSGATGEGTLLVLAASVLCVGHVLTTARAAPTMLRIGRAEDRVGSLAPLIERFVRWSWARAMLQTVTAAVLVAAVVDLGWQGPPSVAAPLIAAIACVSVLAGAGLDQLVVHRSARRTIGPSAYADYLRATDGRNGRALYPAVGLAGTVLVWLAFAASVAAGASTAVSLLLAVAAAGVLAALVVTRRTLPFAATLFADTVPDDPAPLVEALVRGASVRSSILLAVFACLVAALVVS